MLNHIDAGWSSSPILSFQISWTRCSTESLPSGHVDFWRETGGSARKERFAGELGATGFIKIFTIERIGARFEATHHYILISDSLTNARDE